MISLKDDADMRGITNIEINPDWLYHAVNSFTIDKIIASGKIKSKRNMKKSKVPFRALNNVWNGPYYISLVKRMPDLVNNNSYKTYIQDQYALILEDLDAIKTVHKNNNDFWKIISKLPIKKRYSFWKDEYQVKDFISIDKVVGIKIPCKGDAVWTRLCYGYENEAERIDDFLEKMDSVNGDFPFIDVEAGKMIDKDHVKEYILKR